MKFSVLADQLEKKLAHPISFVIFLLWCILMPFISMDAANYGISVLTAALLFLTLGNNRKDKIAVHVKLDDLERAVDTAKTENARLEEKAEEEIQASRD